MIMDWRNHTVNNNYNNIWQVNNLTRDTNVDLNPLSANPEKWSNTLKQIVGNLPTICLIVFDHFMNLALKGLNIIRTVMVIMF